MVAANPDKPFQELLSGVPDAMLEEYIRGFDAEIAELQTFRNAAVAMIEARRYLNGGKPLGGAGPVASRPSAPDAVLAVMGQRPADEWETDAIQEGLRAKGWESVSKTPRNSLEATLSRMVKAKTITRLRRGIYVLPAVTNDESGSAAESGLVA